MLIMANSALSSLTLLIPPERVVLPSAPSGVAASVQISDSIMSMLQSSELGSHSEPRNVQKVVAVQEDP